MECGRWLRQPRRCPELFTQGWIALAGWVHYLAYDLFIGALVSRQIMERKLSRLWLVPILPLAFLFGPIGFLAAQALLLTGKDMRHDQHSRCELVFPHKP